MHSHDVIDGDQYFTIDPPTRQITNNSQKVKLIQYDHNSERFTFECPRFIDGHDMSLCNSIRVNYVNIEKKTKEHADGIYKVDDVQASEDKIVFSWLISRNATQKVGPLNFLIQFACISEDSNVDYEWHTDTSKGVFVYAGMKNEEVIVEEYPDILEKWKNDVLSGIPTDFITSEDLNNYATTNYVDNAISNLGNVATTDYVENAITNLGDIATKEDLNSYATTNYVAELIGGIENGTY